MQNHKQQVHPKKRTEPIKRKNTHRKSIPKRKGNFSSKKNLSVNLKPHTPQNKSALTALFLFQF
jgi:hypothetical protein